MWMTDSEGDVTFVNEGWLRFTGGTSDVGVTFATSAHPDDREEALRIWEEASARREEFRCEYRLRHAPSGGYRWVLELGVPRFAGGEFVGYVGTATDIHERRSMEEALRESEASFRDLADTAPAMMWTTDEDGLVTFVNEGWMRFTGTRLEDELGASWQLGVHPDDAEVMLRTWDEARIERRSWEREYRLLHHSGEYRWIVDRGVPRYEGGRYTGYVGTAIDIHERKTMEGRLLEVYQREHKIAETLQRSLLPERLPQIDGLQLAARYLPGARGAAIGGDWYDVLERPDGRVALVVGDVVGHGLRAAATMGQLRNAFRAYGLVESSPAEVVARINRLVMSGVEDAMATVVYLVLDRETGEVSYSVAGHPPPLVLTPDGPHFLEGGRSVPIGASDPAVFREASAVIPPGSSLLLYTDGLVERRDVGLEERLAELADVAGAAGDDLDVLCERVIELVLGDGEPGRRRGAPRGTSAPGSGRAHQPDAAGRAGVAGEPAAPPGALPARHRRIGRGAVRAHAHDLRGGRQRDRARLRPRRRHLRGGGDLRERGARGHRARQRQLARQARRAPRARPQHHRGADGRGSGVDARRRHRRDDATAARRRTGCVTSPAEIAVERRGGSVVAHVSGEIDMTNAEYMREQLLDSTPNDALALVIDIGGCRYLDSAAIEVLFDLARRLERRRQELRLVVPPSSPLKRVIELTDIGSAAPVYDSLDSALSQ